jgi:hypothetical protein
LTDICRQAFDGQCEKSLQKIIMTDDVNEYLMPAPTFMSFLPVWFSDKDCCLKEVK